MGAVHRGIAIEPSAQAFQEGPREYHISSCIHQMWKSRFRFCVDLSVEMKRPKNIKNTVTHSAWKVGLDCHVPSRELIYFRRSSPFYCAVISKLRRRLSLFEWRERRRKSAANKPRSISESKAQSALSLAVAALGDRGEGVGAEYPDDPEHAGTHIVTQYTWTFTMSYQCRVSC